MSRNNPLGDDMLAEVACGEIQDWKSEYWTAIGGSNPQGTDTYTADRFSNFFVGGNSPTERILRL